MRVLFVLFSGQGHFKLVDIISSEFLKQGHSVSYYVMDSPKKGYFKDLNYKNISNRRFFDRHLLNILWFFYGPFWKYDYLMFKLSYYVLFLNYRLKIDMKSFDEVFVEIFFPLNLIHNPKVKYYDTRLVGLCSEDDQLKAMILFMNFFSFLKYVIPNYSNLLQFYHNIDNVDRIMHSSSIFSSSYLKCSVKFLPTSLHCKVSNITSSKKNVVVSFGTVFSGLPKQFYEHVLKKVFDVFPSSQIHVICGGQLKVFEFVSSLCHSSLIVHDWVEPHDLLISSMYFVTHCGAGSILDSINTGVPMLFSPIRADQFLNAKVCYELGLGHYLDTFTGLDRDSYDNVVKKLNKIKESL